MSYDEELNAINYKYQILMSKAMNDTKNINLDKLQNEVVPELLKSKDEEIEMLNLKYKK